MWTDLIYLSFTFFLLMDSIGNVPVFLAVLRSVPRKRHRPIIWREMLIALGVMVGFAFLGESLMKILKLNMHTILISGGLILFLIALRMIFPAADPGAGNHFKEEPFVVPLAIPLVAGPAVLASILVFSPQKSSGLVIASIVIAWGASSLILLLSPRLHTWLGDRGMLACERLMGLILTLISVQMFLEGISLYIGHVSTL